MSGGAAQAGRARAAQKQEAQPMAAPSQAARGAQLMQERGAQAEQEQGAQAEQEQGEQGAQAEQEQEQGEQGAQAEQTAHGSSALAAVPGSASAGGGAGTEAAAAQGDVLQAMVRKVRKDLLVYAPALFVPALLNVLSVSIYTRLFEPSSFGFYALLLNTTLLATTLVSQWMQQSVQRYRPGYKLDGRLMEFNRNMRSLLLLVVGLIVLAGLAAYPLVPALRAIGPLFYTSCLLLMATQTLFLVCGSILQSDLSAGLFRRMNIANAVLKLGLALLLIWLVYDSTVSILAGLVMAHVLVLIPMVRYTLFAGAKPSDTAGGAQEVSGAFGTATAQGAPDSSGGAAAPDASARSGAAAAPGAPGGRSSAGELSAFFRRFAFYGFPMVGWFLGNSLLNLSDRYIIQFFYSSREVGIYIANYTIVTASIGLICSPLLTASHPLFMNAANQGDMSRKQFEKLLTLFSRVLLLFTLPIIGFVTVFREEVCRILLGGDYVEGALIIPLAMAGIVLWNLSMYGHKGYEVKEKTRWMLVFVLVAAVVNVALNFVLVPTIGYFGASIAAIGGTGTYCLLAWYFSGRFMTWRLPWASIGKGALATLLMAGLLLLLQAALPAGDALPGGDWLRVAAGALLALPAYAAGLLLTRELRGDQLRGLLQTALRARRSTKTVIGSDQA